MFLFFLVAFCSKCARGNPFLVADRVMRPDECKTIINFARSRQHGAAKTDRPTRVLLKHDKAIDGGLYQIFSSHAQAYINAQKTAHLILANGTSCKDDGYLLTGFHDDETLSGAERAFPHRLLVDPPNAQFGAILFLNDNVAGGQLSIVHGPGEETLTVSPECGKLVMFPSSFALAKMLQHVRLGSLYMVSTYFYLQRNDDASNNDGRNNDARNDDGRNNYASE